MNTRFDRDRLARNLPDAYRKDQQSNNAKILEIEKSALDMLREDIGAIDACLDINNASGKTLDLYGEMLGQDRGTATDEQYRVLIKNRINRNYANADYNSIVRALAITFDCEPSDILLKELDEPCKVSLEGIPIYKINERNIDINTAVKIVTGLMPVGVYMEAANFSGTFEFSGPELVYDEDAGFGNVDQTIGGYLGLASSGGKVLPV